MEISDSLQTPVRAVPISGNFEKYLLDSYKYVFLNQAELLHEKSAPFGESVLLKAIADFIEEFYNIKASEEQIVLNSGVENLLWNILQIKSLSKPSIKSDGVGLMRLATQFSEGSIISIKPSVAVAETIGFDIRKIFTKSSIDVREIPVDEQGMNFDFLVTSGATMAYVSAQDIPVGSFEDASSRRHEILEWASEVPYRHIIEYDVNTEKDNYVSFKSEDDNDKVIYLNSFSNLLCRGINASFAVLPSDICADYKQHFAGFECPLPKLTQLALTHFITEGHLISYLSNLEQL